MAAPSQDRPLRAIDLFCGAGGLSEGFRQAGYEITFALDSDDDSCRTYQDNHPDTKVVCESITNLTPQEIGDLAGGSVDVVVGGPSCQGFSTAGRKNGWVRADDKRNELWEHMLVVVAHLRPRAFLLENVPGLVQWREGRFGHRILEGFEELGFRVGKEILLAADFGVPQRRRRLFIVGIQGDEPFRFPAETHMGGWRRDTLHIWEARRAECGLLSHLSSWEAIADLPSAEGSSQVLFEAHELTPFAQYLRRKGHAPTDQEALSMPRDHESLIVHVPRGGTWRDIPGHLLPDRFRGMRRTDSTNLIGRLDPSLPAYTITTQFNNVTAGCFTHPYFDRSLTIREGARLQTFPDDYSFHGSVTSRCRQIGNAVPPLLARVLGGELAQQLLGHAASRWHPAAPAIEPAEELPPPPRGAVSKTARQSKGRRDASPATHLRRALRLAGADFSSNRRLLKAPHRRADILFESARVAVFVDGCFWHGCPIHQRTTKSGTQWWAKRIGANQIQDLATTAGLAEAGWNVVRIWEHEDPVVAAARILDIVGRPHGREASQAS